MEFSLVLNGIFSLFALMLVGLVACKINWLPLESANFLSKILINIATPSFIIASMNEQTYDPNILASLAQVLLIYLALLLFSRLVSGIYLKKVQIDSEDRGIYHNFLIFTNNGFMGLPLAYAFFGAEGLFYAVWINIVMNFFLYTIGTYYGSKLDDGASILGPNLKNQLKKILNMPFFAACIGCVLYFGQLDLSQVLADSFNHLGGMMTPLAMLIFGMQLAQSNPLKLFTDRKLLLMSLLRLVLIPGIAFGVLWILQVPPLLTCIITLIACLPCATMPVTLAQLAGGNAKLAAEGVLVSVIFSIITLPIFGYLFSLLLTTSP